MPEASWGEIVAIISLVLTIVGAVVGTIMESHRRTGKRFDEVTTLVHTEIDDIKENHLSPIEKHLATLNGRVGKNQTKIDAHKEQHDLRLNGLEKWAGNLDEDVTEVKVQVATMAGQLKQS